MPKINLQIALNYIGSNKKLTAVASLGVVLGMAIYIFMNSMLAGFGKKSDESIFKTTPHVRVFSEEQLSRPLAKDTSHLAMLINPKIRPKTNKIINPTQLITLIKSLKDVRIATPQVSQNVFVNMGLSQLSIRAVGIIPDEADQLFNLTATIVEGKVEELDRSSNNVVIGSGIARKLGIRMGDNINVLSSKAITRNFKVVGIFQLNNKREDEGKMYIHLKAAQQLMKENEAYVTDINVQLSDAKFSKQISCLLRSMIPYQAEDWESANETAMAAARMRTIIINFVSTAILLIAGFGIYNILNMTVSQKINDIAILKAMGFEGKDVVSIFVTQAMVVGMMGVSLGVIVAVLMIKLLKKVYIGGDIGYFPIEFELPKFLQGIVFGFLITFLAGFIPARKAAQVDPVSIFRK